MLLHVFKNMRLLSRSCFGWSVLFGNENSVLTIFSNHTKLTYLFKVLIISYLYFGRVFATHLPGYRIIYYDK